MVALLPTDIHWKITRDVYKRQHRLSTIVGADNIVVVKDGTIHAQGTHEKLLETCPLYRDMWQAHIGAKDQM